MSMKPTRNLLVQLNIFPHFINCAVGIRFYGVSLVKNVGEPPPCLVLRPQGRNAGSVGIARFYKVQPGPVHGLRKLLAAGCGREQPEGVIVGGKRGGNFR